MDHLHIALLDRQAVCAYRLPLDECHWDWHIPRGDPRGLLLADLFKNSVFFLSQTLMYITFFFL